MILQIICKMCTIFLMPRPSHVRHAVATLLTDSNRHGWSIDEVERVLRERGVKADGSSIFRALTHLEQAGVLDRVELADGKARYEVHQDHHEHIRCTGCDEVAPIPGCIITESETALAASTGYLVSGHQVIFEGLCPACSKGER